MGRRGTKGVSASPPPGAGSSGPPGAASRPARKAFGASFIASLLALSPARAGSGASPEPGEPSRRIHITVADHYGHPVEDAVAYVFRLNDGRKFSPPEKTYIMDQVDIELVPHVLPIVAGGRVEFPNQDKIHHELYSFSPAKKFELPLYKGKPAHPILFDKPGVVRLGCNIHDWMSGVILVLSNPYFAKTDKQGSANLDVPALDEVEVAVFHERLRGAAEDTVQKVPLGSASASAAWKVDLKAAFKKKKPAVY